MHFFSQRGPSFIKTLKWSELHARVPTHVLNETFHQLGLVFGLNDKYEPMHRLWTTQLAHVESTFIAGLPTVLLISPSVLGPLSHSTFLINMDIEFLLLVHVSIRKEITG